MKKQFTRKKLCLLLLLPFAISLIAEAQKPNAISYASDGTIIIKDAKQKSKYARISTTTHESSKRGSNEIKRNLLRPMSTAATISCNSPITTNATSNCGAVVTYNAPTISDNVPFYSQTFNFTGQAVDWVVPPGVTAITVKAWGAQGGANWVNNANFGGYSEGTLSVTPGETLKIYVGGQATTTIGGWNGGGNGDGAGKGGGGASDIRQGGNTLNDRKIVAAGGGGAGYWSTLHVVGGVGGGLTGGDGYREPDYNSNPGGRGATQTAGGVDGTCVSFNVTALAGSFGQGGSPLGLNCGCESYGGGGGWYGGAGSGNCRGGGGGSGYIGGVTNGSMQAGIQTGNGKIEISFGAVVTQTAGLPSGALFPIGVTTNTFEFDDNGTPKSCSFPVTVNAVPTSVSYSSASYCKPTVASNITPTITGLSGGTFTSSPAGLSINSTTGIVDLLGSDVGIYTITYGFSGCNLPAATTSLTINSTLASPTSVSVNNTSVCQGTSVNLTATCSSGVVNWYNQSTGGSVIGTGSPLSQNPTVNTTYYATCKTGTCESGSLATSQVNVTSATLIVSNLNDSGPGSFRQAIIDANASSCVSIIDATGVTGTIDLLSRLPNVDANISINGPTTGNLILKRNSVDNFRILSIGSGKTVTVNDLILTNGNDNQGAGINNSGNLTLNRLIITGNTAVQGAGIQNDNILVMNNCLVVNNGFYNFESYGTTNTFNNCTISGRVYLSGNQATLILKNSYIEDIFYKLKINTAASNNNFFMDPPVTLPVGSIVDEKPQFINSDDVDGADNIYRTPDDGYNILGCSPMINAGNNTDVTGTDLEGNTRIFNTTVDIGAYEFQSNTFVPLRRAVSPNTNTPACYINAPELTASCGVGQVNWYNGDTFLSAGTSFNIQTLPPGNHSLSVYCVSSNPECQSLQQYAYARLPNPPSESRTGKPVYCSGEDIVLVGSCRNGGGTVTWYNQASGGSIVGTGNTVTIPGVLVPTTYYAGCVLNNCESNRTPLTVKIGNNTRKYVKYNAVGNNDGSSWANAYTTLQQALNASCDSTEIWVAKGTYYPTEIPFDSTGNRYKTFYYSTNLLIYGGFSGINETLLSQRDITANPTILSGDFNNDDSISGEGSTLSITNNNENAYHVFLFMDVTNAGIIDGFTIKGGNANNTANYYLALGGGILFTARNYLPPGEFGLKLNNIVFTGNNSINSGGGMHNMGQVQITHSKFLKNTAFSGGGLGNRSLAFVSDVSFESNRTLYKGGGLSVDSAQILLNRVYFKNNYAQHIGGGFALDGGFGKVDNAVLTGNSARYGGAIFNTLGYLNITNSTIAQNTATNGGGLVYSNLATDSLKNTIVWGNIASTSVDNVGYFEHPMITFSTGTPTLTQINSLIQGFGTANGNIDANPQFRNENDADGADNIFFTVDDGLNLTKCSPAINVGTSTGIETTDILNNPRPYNGGNVDIGAFEYSVMPLSTNVSASQTAVCGSTTIALTASCAVGTVTWYNQASGGSAIGTGSPLNQNVSATTTFYASCKDACDESSRTATQQIVYGGIASPTINAPNPKVLCAPNTLTLTASGCAGTINWSNGSSGSSLTLSSVGTYSISATCTVGSCTSPASTAVTGLQIITQPSAPTIVAPNPKVVCAPSTLTLTASGCAGTVTWSTGASGTSLTLSSVGTYSISATCTVGSCTSPASSTVTGLQIVTQPAAPTINAPNPKVVCAPNTLTLTASGCAGTVNWSNGLSGSSLTLSSVGTYSISATCTVGNCTSPASTAVTGLQIVTQPAAPTINAPNPKVVCAPSTLTLTASGCAGTVTWSTGASGTSLTLSSVGTYSISATCTVGSCTSPASSTVTGLQIVTQPAAPTINAPNPKVVCAPNTLTLTASGCAGTVTWSNGSSGSSLTLSSVGTYSISATCSVGSCTSPASATVTGLQIIPQPSAPTIVAPNPKVVCAPNTLTLTASGCAGTVTWSTGASGTSLILSSVGTYSISATCTVGSCTSLASSTVTGLQIVTQPSAPTIVAPNPKVVCAPSTLTLTASGCAGTVTWSTGASGTSLTLSSVGTYSISATCTVGSCTSPASSTVTGLQIVTQPSAPTIVAPNPKVVCAPNTLTLTASGCGGTVNWSNGSSGSSLTLSSVGTYSISATCTVGSCTSPASSTVTGLQIVTQPAAPTINAPNPKVVCAPSTLTLTASGCAGTVTWSNGSSGSSLTLSSVGTYSISATCTVGSCTSPASSTVTGLQIVTQPSAPTITAPSPKVVCAPNTLTLTASGCGGTVTWSTGASGTSLTLSSVGTYSISATCTVGSCTSPASSTVTGLQIVTQPAAPTINAPNPKVVCAPSTLTLTASGCAGTVTWSNGSSGSSLTLSSVGTYSISATCTIGSCTSLASTTVTGLQIVTQPSAPTINAPNPKVVCAPNTLALTASGCAGTVTWSNGSSGSSLTLSSVGTYSISATCTVGSCTSPASSTVIGLQIVTQPAAPTINAPNPKVVCAPNTLTLTASGCGGTVTWSTGASGTSLTLSSVGTYSISATCTVGSCTSPTSSTVTGLQIVTQPAAPTINAPNPKVVCAPSTLTLTASGCAGTINWSNGSSGSSLTLSSVGTYSISATCTVGSCTSVSSTAVTGLQIAVQAVAQATNTGPYIIGQTIQLNASGGNSYSWSGPATFSSSSQSPVIPNALASNGGIYTVTVTNGACSATATTNVIVSGIDPCVQILDLQYVKAGNPFEPMFSLKDDMIIQQIPEQVSIIAKPICPTTAIGSVDLTITGPEINWTILQNVEPYAVFDNLGVHVYGRNFIPGTYTMTVTGYSEDNRIGGTVYGPVVTTFTVVGTMAVINAPTIPNNRLCAGSMVDVTFATTGSFDSSNIFNIQLSDSTGGFTNPTLIGITTTAGTITCQLPQNLTATGHYLIRVASSNQVVASNPTMQYLSVTAAVKTLTTNISAGTITEQASLQINADNKITSPANATYNAGKAIILNPGFEAKEGSVFKAQIQGCNN